MPELPDLSIDQLLAAYRADITEIILPKENEKDLDEIAEEVRDVLQIHLVERMDEVLALALEGEVGTLPKSEAGLSKGSDDPSIESGSVAH